jgi:hypothetical protein
LIGFVAAFDESDAIFSEFSERIDDGIYGVHCCWREIVDRETLDRFIWDFFFFLFERAKNMRERESLMTIALQKVQTPFYFYKCNAEEETFPGQSWKADFIWFNFYLFIYFIRLKSLS